jgi:hypothetical protein
MKKWVDICKEDGSLYACVDIVDDTIIKTKIVTGEITEPLFYRNQFGGLDAIDKLGQSDYHPFEFISDLLIKLLRAQCEARKEARK